ncbi:MAG: VOC family protein [Coriobacteriales bacterium]|jgi:hypothetical protein|nr:VOC family protein [Coriobacteriales bacterium]
MHETILNKYATNQISYYVEDLEAFARQHMALFGSGPFFYMPPLPTTCNYRGREIEFIMQTAFGQFGNLQIELVQVTVEPGTPNPYAELGHYGFHHLSNWVDDFDGAMKIFTDAGYEPLFTMESGNGMRVAYIDLTRTLGHYLEMHRPIKQIWDIYAAAARDWDGVTDPWRPFAFPSA